MIRKSVFSSLVVAVALLLGSSAFAQWNISVVGSPAGGTLQGEGGGGR